MYSKWFLEVGRFRGSFAVGGGLALRTSPSGWHMAGTNYSRTLRIPRKALAKSSSCREPEPARCAPTPHQIRATAATADAHSADRSLFQSSPIVKSQGVRTGKTKGERRSATSQAPPLLRQRKPYLTGSPPSRQKRRYRPDVECSEYTAGSGRCVQADAGIVRRPQKLATAAVSLSHVSNIGSSREISNARFKFGPRLQSFKHPPLAFVFRCVSISVPRPALST